MTHLAIPDPDGADATACGSDSTLAVSAHSAALVTCPVCLFCLAAFTEDEAA